MAQRIVVQFSVANLGDRTATHEIQKNIVATLRGTDVYHLEPPPGAIVGAAFDWTVITSIADILGIASALWTIYAEFIRPRRTKNRPSVGLYIVVDAEQGLTWFLGHDIDDEDQFIHEFVTAVQGYHASEGATAHLEQTLAEVVNSDLWVRKNPKR